MSSSQNLVKNGSFEDKKYCPSDFNMQKLTQVEQWWQVSDGTPDYFHACSKKAGVPNNLFGSVEAADGVAYTGLVTYSGSTRNYREYLQTKLKRPLEAGEQICIEFNLSAADKSLYICDAIGIHISKKKSKAPQFGLIDENPQVANLKFNMIDAFGTWVKISDTFIAKGGEQYLTIGNFLKDPDITILRRTKSSGAISTNTWSYLYIDNVVIKSVKERKDCSCVNDIIATTINNPPLELSEISDLEIKSIHFDFDKSEIQDSSIYYLEETLKLLHINKSMFIQIIGHTDNIGKKHYNDNLSKERSQKVLQYFINKGIDKSRLKNYAKGSSDPISENSSDYGRAKNRRVEFQLIIPKYELVK